MDGLIDRSVENFSIWDLGRSRHFRSWRRGKRNRRSCAAAVILMGPGHVPCPHDSLVLWMVPWQKLFVYFTFIWYKHVWNNDQHIDYGAFKRVFHNVRSFWDTSWHSYQKYSYNFVGPAAMWFCGARIFAALKHQFFLRMGHSPKLVMINVIRGDDMVDGRYPAPVENRGLSRHL